MRKRTVLVNLQYSF